MYISIIATLAIILIAFVAGNKNIKKIGGVKPMIITDYEKMSVAQLIELSENTDIEFHINNGRLEIGVKNE